MKTQLRSCILAVVDVRIGCAGRGTSAWSSGSSGRTARAILVGCALQVSVACSDDDESRAGLAFHPCEQGLECATVTVPVDYDQPEAEQLELAIARLPRRSGTRGTVFLNPGGPGGSGVDLLVSLARYPSAGLSEVLPDFQVVSFDPRGVGRSAGSGCPAPISDLITTTESDPAAVGEELGARCAPALGALFDELGSMNVVRDMDQIREAFGLERLNFVGISYGTRLAGLYAQTFPETSGAIVLDAPVSPRADLVELTRAQAIGMETIQATFYATCLDDPSCPSDPEATFSALRASVPTSSLRFLGEPVRDELFMTLWTFLVAEGLLHPLLVTILWSYEQDGSTSLLQTLFSALEEEAVLTDTSSLLVNIAVNCSDQTAPATPEQLDQLRAELAQAAPTFGDLYASDAAVCERWPSPPDPVSLLGGETVQPLLIIGGINDPRTPLPFAEELATLYPQSRLLISEHVGHAAMFRGSACVETAVADFLESLELPAPGTRCPDPGTSILEDAPERRRVPWLRY